MTIEELRTKWQKKVKGGEKMITEEIFGVRLKMLLQERGLSQKAFARMIGTSEQAVCRWIGGSRYPHFKFLIRTADALGISLDMLCGADFTPASGKWVDNKSQYIKELDAYFIQAKCSVCERYSDRIDNYTGIMSNECCSHCGAKMKGD